MTPEERTALQRMLKAREKKLREPWREYCAWRPDDMPRKGGDPVALMRLAADPELRPDPDLRSVGGGA